MQKEKANHLILGCALIILTKVFDMSNIFLLVGLVFVFDAFFSTKKENNESESD